MLLYISFLNKPRNALHKKVLAARRKICGGELGGPPLLKWVSFGVLISLWVIYIVVSSLVVISNLGPCDR